MAQDKKQGWHSPLSLPQTSSSALRGKQSVRATFKLTTGCVEAISIVATHLGIKQKSLFDHLAEDSHSLMSIANEIQNRKLKKCQRIQKTYVLSRNSLISLDSVSKDYNAPRDALVEYSVRRLLPIIAKEREKHVLRKKLFVDLTEHFEQGKKLLEKAITDLGEEDPLCDKFEAVMTFYTNAYNNIDSFIERSKIIEEFDHDLRIKLFK